MNASDAARLISPAIASGGAWADLGAGSGTFTTAIARLLGRTGRVYAVERDERALGALKVLARRQSGDSAPITVFRGDFTKPLALPELDGIVLANSLHFVPDDAQSSVLARLATKLDPDGAIVIVEYDNRPRSRWVPFPVSLIRLADLARDALLAPPVLLGRRDSDYGGTMYAARLGRPASTVV